MIGTFFFTYSFSVFHFFTIDIYYSFNQKKYIHKINYDSLTSSLNNKVKLKKNTTQSLSFMEKFMPLLKLAYQTVHCFVMWHNPVSVRLRYICA